MSKVTELADLQTPALGDLLPIIDVSDTSMAGTGTNKKITVGDLLGDYTTNADLLAALANSPSLGGTPTAPTASLGTNTTQIATTAFVVAELQSRLSNINGGAPDTVYSLTYSGGTP